MGYGGSTDWLGIPKPLAGETSSAAEEALRSDIPDWVLEILTKALTDANGDGTLGDGFQVSDDGGLDIEVSAGQGFIGGLVIEAAAPTAKADLTDDQLNYIFLKKTATTFEDQSFTVEISLSSSMADAILIAAVTCAAGDITDVDNTPTGRVPYIRDNPNPQVINDIPGLLVVAPSGGNYTSPKTAIEAASAGDVVYICAGTYNIAAAITVPNNNLTIIGANRGACILNFTAADATNCINLNGKSGIRIAFLTITAAAGKTGYGITGTSAHKTIISKVHFSFTGLARAINLTTSDNVRISECGFDTDYTGAKYCIYCNGCNYLSCRDNRLALTGTDPLYALYVSNADYCQIEGNLLTFSDTHANLRALWLSSIDDNTNVGNRIAGNILKGAGDLGEGIRVAAFGDPHFLDETQITGNSVFNFNVGVAVGSVGARETLVHGNKVATCTAGVSDSGTNTNSQDND